jgi:hypothetical protein
LSESTCRQRFEQFRNISLRTSVAVEVSALSRQQKTALSRLGFENSCFNGGNIAKHPVRVFHPAEAVSLPSYSRFTVNATAATPNIPKAMASVPNTGPGRISFHRLGQIVPDALSRGVMPTTPSEKCNCFTCCRSGPCGLLARRVDDRTPSWKYRSTRTSGAAGRGDR